MSFMTSWTARNIDSGKRALERSDLDLAELLSQVCNLMAEKAPAKGLALTLP
jgi:hypothetical protein